jgi:hypothetical protein
LSVCVFTCTLLVATLLAVLVGGFGGGPTETTQLTSADHHALPGAPNHTTSAQAAAEAGQKSQVTTGSKVTKRTAAKATPADTKASSMAGMPGMAMAAPSVTKPVLASPSLAGVKPSTANPPNRQYHEFQVNCSISHHRADDPIVYPGRPGASHNHTFFGNRTTNSKTTQATLQKGSTSCKVPADRSAYWMPTLSQGSKVIDPVETITYYKSDVKDYKSVRPFPLGLRFVAGSPKATEAQFAAHGYWSCVSGKDETHIPATCPAGNKLIARLVAPSCWDGVHLDVPDHHSHMAYPVQGRCTTSHPVALPMLQFKIPYPVRGGDMSKVKLSTGPGYTFHYDFFNAWDPATQAALIKTCINGGMQCDAQGYDQHYPNVPAALGADFKLRS